MDAPLYRIIEKWFYFQDADHKEDARSHKELYSDLFTMVLSSLRPGGHLLIGDHVGALGLFDHLKLMEEAGTFVWKNFISTKSRQGILA